MNQPSLQCFLAGAAVWLAAAVAPVLAHAEVDPAIRTYTATYQVHYDGRQRGTSSRSVAYDDATGTYVFRSVTVLRGFLLRMAAPRPIVEHSVFRSRNGSLIPLEFSYQDGTRRGAGNVEIRFDWDAGTLSVTKRGTVAMFDAEQGTLDPGSAQVRVMVDAARPARTTTLPLADGDGPLRYRYSRPGREIVETIAGSQTAEVTLQQRDGSSRETLYWLAPALDYLPVRIEQRRDGETRLAFVLESVEWLETD
ncbi:MAG TPA: DUF3108 domain-containing protein [Gammaproteobacteria bacterium]